MNKAINTPHARTVAANTFKSVLSELSTRKNVTELDFRDAWLKKMEEDPEIIAAGWYDPPPQGMTVIADDAKSSSRISYTSLREPEYWPTDRVIDFENDMFFAFCSPISKRDNYQGDFDITLYFGTDELVLKHFRNCHKAMHSLLELLSEVDDAQSLCRRTNEVLQTFKLTSSVVCITDSTPSNLGHMLPKLDELQAKTLSAEQIEYLRKSRKFINATADWKLSRYEWFTYEPQMRSTEDETLPQISFHYICSVRDGVTYSTDVEEILKEQKF